MSIRIGIFDNPEFYGSSLYDLRNCDPDMLSDEERKRICFDDFKAVNALAAGAHATRNVKLLNYLLEVTIKESQTWDAQQSPNDYAWLVDTLVAYIEFFNDFNISNPGAGLLPKPSLVNVS